MNKIIKIIIISLFVLVCILIIIIIFGLSIMGLFVKQTPENINLDPSKGGLYVDCSKNQQSCTSDLDCLNSCMNDGYNYTCNSNICTTTIPDNVCNKKLGGIPIWTGWGGFDLMEWECACSESLFAGTIGCSTINNNICQGTKNSEAFNWDATTNKNPTCSDCTCQDDQILLCRNDGTPICIPKTIDPKWYEYTNSITKSESQS